MSRREMLFIISVHVAMMLLVGYQAIDGVRRGSWFAALPALVLLALWLGATRVIRGYRRARAHQLASMLAGKGGA